MLKKTNSLDILKYFGRLHQIINELIDVESMFEAKIFSSYVSWFEFSDMSSRWSLNNLSCKICFILLTFESVRLVDLVLITFFGFYSGNVLNNLERYSHYLKEKKEGA